MGYFCILSGSFVWRKSAHRCQIGMLDRNVFRLDRFANFSCWQFMISSRLRQFPVCSNTVFVENAATSWSSEGFSLFWNSIRVLSWLLPMPDNVCLSIAPWFKELGKKGGTGTLWDPARSSINSSKIMVPRHRPTQFTMVISLLIYKYHEFFSTCRGVFRRLSFTKLWAIWNMTSAFLRTFSEVFKKRQRPGKNTFQLGGRFSRYWSKISWRSMAVLSVAFKLKLYALHSNCSSFHKICWS